MSLPDPDELMDAHAVDEPIDEHEFDVNNANEMDDDFGAVNTSPLPIASSEEPITVEREPSPQVVTSAAIDLDLIAASYTGYGLMNRLLFIADTCPPMQKDALVMLLSYVMENTADVPMYMNVIGRLESLQGSGGTSASSAPAEPAPSADSNGDNESGSEATILKQKGCIPQCDSGWVEANTAKNQAQLDQLLTEFKRQKDEGVKESTRRAMDELFHHQIYMGQLQDAVKLYGRGMREYCTSSKHVIQMLLSWLEVTIHLGQWHRVEPLISQIERAILEASDSEAVSTTSAVARGSRFAGSAAQSATKSMKELIETSKAKVAAINALFRLHSKSYRDAAEKCLTIDLDAFDYPLILSSKDIAIYGTICALATFDRNELREKVLGSVLFRKFLESEPKLVELLEKFIKNGFGTCLDIMEEIRDQLLLNMYLSVHVKELYMLIRRRAIVQYFTPYVVADIPRMAEVFRVTVDELENELVEMIENDDISAQIDSFKKVLYAKKVNKQGEIYKQALELTRSLTSYANGVILRAAIHEAQICVGQNEAKKRRPAQGLVTSEEYLERATSKGQSSNVSARGIMARIFGSGRAPPAPPIPTVLPQSVEADSSNQVQSSAVSTATSQKAKEVSKMDPSVSSEDVNMTAQGQSADEQDSGSVPSVPPHSDPNVPAEAADEQKRAPK